MHLRLNQIIYTTNDGLANVLFDEKLSHRGAKLCVAKKKRTAELTEMNVNINVVVPFQPKSFRKTRLTSIFRILLSFESFFTHSCNNNNSLLPGCRAGAFFQ